MVEDLKVIGNTKKKGGATYLRDFPLGRRFSSPMCNLTILYFKFKNGFEVKSEDMVGDRGTPEG